MGRWPVIHSLLCTASLSPTFVSVFFYAIKQHTHTETRTQRPSSLFLYFAVDKGKVPWAAGPPGSSLPGSVVHPSLQDRDFAPLKIGDPLFERLDGSVDVYDGAFGDIV